MEVNGGAATALDQPARPAVPAHPPAPPAPGPEFHALKLVESRPHWRVLSRVLGVMLALAVAGLILTPWVQNVGGSGRVIAYAPMERQQTIDAPVEGRIVKWHVVEGSQVKAGDLVAELADIDAGALGRLEQERAAVQSRVDAATAREQALSDRILNLRNSMRNALEAADSRVSMAAERVRQAEQGVEAAKAAMQTAKIQIDRQKRLIAKGLTSNRTLELAELDFVRSTTEFDRAEAALAAARNERAALEADRQRAENDFRSSLEDARASQQAAKVEIANARAEIQRVDLRVSRQNTQLVKAPRSGTIFRLLEQPGSNVMKSGDPIAILIPQSAATVVELWVKGNDVPLISEGRGVRLQFEGWPALQFAGWPSVAVGTFGGRVLLVDPTDNGQGKFRILVEPDPNDEPWPSQRYMRQGVRANGWVLLNTVPIWFELWRQFNGFPPVIAPEEPGAGGGAAKK